MERPEARFLRPPLQGADCAELGAEGVEEERADELEDVLLARVVGAEVVARGLVHHALEHRAEYRGRDLRPVERGAVEDGLAHFGGERGDRERLGEQPAVHVRKRGDRLVAGGEAALRRRVQHLEELRELGGEVAAVRRGALRDIAHELVGLEYVRVLGEEAEEQPDEVDFERMADVADGLHRVVELRHLLGGLAVHRVLLADFVLALRADHEAEELHELAQVLQGKLREGVVLLEVVEAPALEVRDDDGAREDAGLQRAHVFHRLLVGGVEVLAARLHLDEDLALPEAVGVALRAVGELHAVLKGVDYDDVHAKQFEELLQEALRLTLLVVGVLPASGERHRRLADLVPRFHGALFFILL